MAVDVELLAIKKSLRIQRITGMEAFTVKLRVTHDLGEFELLLEAARVPDLSGDDLFQAMARDALRKLSKELLEAANSPLKKAKPRHP